MLTLLGSRTPMCDRLSRRQFLSIGGLALGGLALPGLLRAEQASGVNGHGKGIIMIYLPGGPPHLDMWDLKPHAPAEIRGEFEPIATKVPGLEIGEMFPRMASIADRLTFIRSIVGATGEHYAFQCLTGYHTANQPAGGRPAVGSVLSKMFGPRDAAVPPTSASLPKWATCPGPITVSPVFSASPMPPSPPR